MLLLLIYCLMYFPLFVGVLPLFCYALLNVDFGFAIILKRKRKLIDLLLLSHKCSMALPHGAVGLSAVCHDGIS